LFKKEYLAQVRPLPKVRELFERLRQDGKRIALASSGNGDEDPTDLLEKYYRSPLQG
jgi:hypothetical protein